MIDIVTEGLPPQEVVDRLMNGWMVVPNVHLSGVSVATLDNPNPTSQRADVWVLFPPGPTMPQIAAMHRLSQAADLYPNAKTALDWMAINLFNATLDDLKASLQAGQEAAAGSG